MQEAVEFVSCHGLGVDRDAPALLAVLDLGVDQGFPNRGFAAPRGAQQKHRPPHREDLPQLRDFQNELILGLVPWL